jgi:hypothetical protein
VTCVTGRNTYHLALLRRGLFVSGTDPLLTRQVGNRVSAPTRYRVGRRAGAWHNTRDLEGRARHARESYTAKATCRRPNSDVLAREGERVGLGLSVPYGPIMTKPLVAPPRGGAFSLWLKMKNPDAPAVKREAEEDWGREKWR